MKSTDFKNASSPLIGEFQKGLLIEMTDEIVMEMRSPSPLSNASIGMMI